MRRRRGSTGLEVVIWPGRAEASLWRRLRFEGDAACRGLLFDRYVGLARTIAARYFFRGPAAQRMDRNDLDQLAFEGLLQAIDRYDPLNGAPFGAYARRRIAGNIADGMSRMTEVGTQIHHRNRMEQERLRSLAAGEVETQAQDAIGALSKVAIGLALGLMLEGTALIRADDEADPTPNAYESLQWRQIQARLRQELCALPDREATILRYHYDTGLQFTQIAEFLGLSRGRVSQLHRAAIERLRNKIGAFV